MQVLGVGVHAELSTEDDDVLKSVQCFEAIHKKVLDLDHNRELHTCTDVIAVRQLLIKPLYTVK